MAPKRSRSSSGSYDRTKFVSAEAFAQYTQSFVQKSPVPERGFDLPTVSFGNIISSIKVRHWEKFGAQPEATVMPVVQEFYANVLEHENGFTFCKGKQVPFDSLTINQFFNILEIEEDEYANYVH